ncbi:efflux RND transporter periplasmic adaptor subunit [Salidesulfovibrio onnuriiensis]|uniref:efflux RND transporter periplasmic adaptor subunit n=1 Tax=Salidesulfovibrio onnuriiensis TaxID=2583823 RepID=UPI0011CBD928|nr:efflux RND transporter periplasmic adaptor subunit [Salidesulfovibrio onnuriiensis]
MKYLHTLLALLLLGAFSACGGDIEPGTVNGPTTEYHPEAEARAQVVETPRLHEAVGSVQAKTDVRVEAQVTGRVMEVAVRPGDAVKTGDVLVKLDSRQSESRLEQTRQAQQAAVSTEAQARQGVAAAQAAFTKASSTFKRMSQLHEDKVITTEELEKAETAFLQAKAVLAQARDGLAAAQASARQVEKNVQEAEIGLGYTTITAPADGEVSQRFVDPGDLAIPGKDLLNLRTSGGMRLEAMVREGLIGHVRMGQSLEMIITALGETPVTGQVEEIEPLADPVTRSFVVKVTLPDLPGLYPGMFGRVLIPLGSERTITVPTAAIRSVGQLKTVMVRDGERWLPVYVRTGRPAGDGVEILSGLNGGETVALDTARGAK